MNWDALGAIAELLGAIAVLMTLVYLAIQLRQNNAFAQAQAMQARTDTQINMISFVMSNPEYLNAIVALTKSVSSSDTEEISQEERGRATIALSVMRTTLENTFEQYKKGLIGRDFYEGVTVQTIKLYGRAILSLDLWLTEDFKSEVEEILAASPILIRLEFVSQFWGLRVLTVDEIGRWVNHLWIFLGFKGLSS